ncbi:MAG: 50S ribosomal protein L30 [Geobacter sp.]|nr:50S ribosomal protein L30 [Geobacter sp.]
MAGELRITLVRSLIGKPESQRAVLKGLGLSKVNGSVVLKDTPEIRGMINKVIHLVKVSE